MITRNNHQKDLIKSLGDAITAIVAVDIALGVENNTPFPSGDAVAITIIRQERQATNEIYYPDRAGTVTHEADRVDLSFVTVTAQLDCYGANAFDNSNTLLFALRSDLMLEYGLQSLYCSEPINMAYMNAKSKQVPRWTLDAKMQFNTQFKQEQDTALEIELDVFKHII